MPRAVGGLEALKPLRCGYGCFTHQPRGVLLLRRHVSLAALLQRNADPNARARWGYTPLHYAASLGWSDKERPHRGAPLRGWPACLAYRAIDPRVGGCCDAAIDFPSILPTLLARPPACVRACVGASVSPCMCTYACVRECMRACVLAKARPPNTAACALTCESCRSRSSCAHAPSRTC